MHNSNINTIPIVNVHSFSEDNNTHLLVPQHGGQYYTLPTKWVIYNNKSGIQFQRKEDNYYYRHHTFKIYNNTFIYKGVSISLPQRDRVTTIERVCLSLGFSISNTQEDAKVDINKVSFKEVLQVLTSLALLDLKIIPKSLKHTTKFKYGEIIFNLYLKVITGSGNISAKEKNIRYLNDVDTYKLKFKLFDESNYQVGSHSKQYTPTKYLESIISKVFNLFKELDFIETNIDMEPLDFKVSFDLLNQIRLRDVMLILNNCIGYDGTNFIIRPEIMDIHYSRVYSVFTSISSDTRKRLGFINYDINAALQTICLQLVDDESKYPLHQELVNDKKAFRQKVIDQTGKDLDWVKTELTKINNLQDKMPLRYNNTPILKEYFEEAIPLRKEIIYTCDSLILSRAREFAKPKWEKVWVKDKKEPEFVEVGKKESSIFFFIWTQYERMIRKSMMNSFSNSKACHQVHDAIYSIEDINTNLIERNVFKDTGFTVQISKN